MKRSFYFIAVILLVLIAVSVYLLKSKSGMNTINIDSRKFSFTDTAAITKIFIADKEGNKCTLSRTSNGWMVNDKYNCRAEAILNVLEAVKHMEVKMPVSKQAKKNVIKFMSSNAIKVEIYVGDEKVKQYYIGHEPNDSEGSFMILTNLKEDENYPDPFICFIPGFKGILQPRFITKENEWRDRLVLNYIPPQLKQIRVENLGDKKDSSFVIDFLSSNNFKLKKIKGEELSFDMAKMRQYLIYFQNISYEVLITGKNIRLQDSLKKTSPFSVITIRTVDQKMQEYKFYRKQFSVAVLIQPQGAIIDIRHKPPVQAA